MFDLVLVTLCTVILARLFWILGRRAGIQAAKKVMEEWVEDLKHRRLDV